MNQPYPEWSAEMQALWDRAMYLARTRGAYGCAFPQPGTSFKPPTAGSMLNDIIFVATASDEQYEAHLAAVREDMIAWKARVAASGGKRKLLLNRPDRPVNLAGLDLANVEFKL